MTQQHTRSTLYVSALALILHPACQVRLVHPVLHHSCCIYFDSESVLVMNTSMHSTCT